jgi:hypothetical protein
MRGNIRPEASISHHVGERPADVRDRPTIPLDSQSLPLSLPAPQMRQQARRQRDRWLSLFRFQAACRAAIEHPAL